METIYEGIGQSIPFIAIAAIVITIAFLAHLEKMRKMELFHRERLAAIEKGLPPPEMPTEPLPVPRPTKPLPPNAALLTGILMSAAAIGAMAVLFVTLPEPAHGFWIVPLPVLLVGFGLMLFHFLKNDGFNRFN